MAARAKTIVTISLADLDLDPAGVGGSVATTRVTDSHKPEARAATRMVREPAGVAAQQIVDFLVERRLI